MLPSTEWSKKRWRTLRRGETEHRDNAQNEPFRCADGARCLSRVFFFPAERAQNAPAARKRVTKPQTRYFRVSMNVARLLHGFPAWSLTLHVISVTAGRSNFGS